MSQPSLKHSLASWTGLPRIERTFEPRKTRKTAAEVEKRFGDVQPKAPTPYDLQELYRRVVKSWGRDRSLTGLDPRDLRRLPWILFYPDTGTKGADWLGAKSAVLREYGHWLSSGRRGPCWPWRTSSCAFFPSVWGRSTSGGDCCRTRWKAAHRLPRRLCDGCASGAKTSDF